MDQPVAAITVSQRRLEELRSSGLLEPRGEVVFAHSGPIDHDGVAALVAVAERFSLDREDGVSLRKRLISVLVEGLENIHHHAVVDLDRASFALLMRSETGYRFAFGNGAQAAMAAQLTHRVEVLNLMDEVDLKEHYLKLLANDARSEHGGAGLGLMTMARRSEKPLVAHTEPIGGGLVFFSLELRVSAW